MAKPDFHGLRGTREYKTWSAMIQRCTNPKCPSYPRYGALGVSVCDRWASFQNFLEDMGPRPTGSSLDRIDAFGNYEPANCRWATKLQQARNRRAKTTTFEQAEQARALYAGGMKPTEIARTLGIKLGSVNGIVYLGQVSIPD